MFCFNLYKYFLLRFFVLCAEISFEDILSSLVFHPEAFEDVSFDPPEKKDIHQESSGDVQEIRLYQLELLVRKTYSRCTQQG